MSDSDFIDYGIPGGFVKQGWDLYSNLAVGAFEQTQEFIEQLGSFSINPVNYDTSFSPPAENFAPFVTPTKPSEPTLYWNLDLPEPLDLDVPEMPDFGDAPESDLKVPNLDFTGEPDPLDIAEPPDPPTLDDVRVPDEPVLNFPDELPRLTEIEFPDKPDLIEVEFEGERPEFQGNVPDTFIDFTEEEYQSDCLDRLKVEIKRILDDGTGMPPVVEQMLVDRARTREDREATRAVQQAMEEASARGFTLPPGHTYRRAQEIRQNNQNQANTFNREVFVQRRQEEIQNYQFAIAQGIALENILINAHLAVQQRAFEFARAVVDLHFRQLEAYIATYNAAIQGYQADAAVYEAKLRAEINKLEQYRLEIQAESLKIDADRSKVEVYQAQLAAVEQQVNVYRARVEAAKAISEKNNATVRAYVGQIQGYQAQIDAKRTEWEAWATKVRGQLGKTQAFEAETRAFAADVSAYESRVRAESLKPQIETQIRELEVREQLANLERYRSEANAEASRMQSEAAVFGSQAQMYAADGSIAENQQAARDRQYRSLVETRRTESERALAQAQLDVDQVLRSGQLLSQALDGAARASGQLSAGAMSAVNLAASVRGSSSWNVNLSGEI